MRTFQEHEKEVYEKYPEMEAEVEKEVQKMREEQEIKNKGEIT